MKIYRYNTISNIPGVMQVVPHEFDLHQDFEPSITDKSHFVPIADAVRSLKAGSISPEHYDFPDGKDNGMAIPLSRQRGLDISEVSEAIVNQMEDVKGKIKDFKKQQEIDLANKAISDIGRATSAPKTE